MQANTKFINHFIRHSKVWRQFKMSRSSICVAVQRNATKEAKSVREWSRNKFRWNILILFTKNMSNGLKNMINPKF